MINYVSRRRRRAKKLTGYYECSVCQYVSERYYNVSRHEIRIHTASAKQRICCSKFTIFFFYLKWYIRTKNLIEVRNIFQFVWNKNARFSRRTKGAISLRTGRLEEFERNGRSPTPFAPERVETFVRLVFLVFFLRSFLHSEIKHEFTEKREIIPREM